MLAPPPLNRFFCSYPADTNSMAAIETFKNGCLEQCHPPRIWECSFPQHELKACLQAQLDTGVKRNNEIVIDAQFLQRNLPHSIMAVFYMDEASHTRAASVHKHFLRVHQLDESTFPLLHLSLNEGFRIGTLVSAQP